MGEAESPTESSRSKSRVGRITNDLAAIGDGIRALEELGQRLAEVPGTETLRAEFAEITSRIKRDHAEALDRVEDKRARRRAEKP